MDSDKTSENPKKARLWPAFVIPLLGLGGFVLSYMYSNVILMLWIIIAVLTAAVWLIWLTFFSRLSLSGKFKVFLIPAVIFGAMVGLLRVDYYDGDTIPVFDWRWNKPKAVNVEVEKNAGIDLVTKHPHDVPQYLGPQRRPEFPNITLDDDWTKNPPKLLWKQAIGEGFGSFAVVGDYAVTQQQKEDEELVVCYEWRTGKALWVHSDKARFENSVGGIGPRSTPIIDNGKVYTLGATGIFNCLDGKDGKVLWSHNIVTENGAKVPMWGKSCSPLIDGDLVIVSAGGEKNKSLVAYHKDTGKLVWSGGTAPSGYTAPTLVTLCGVRQIVIVNRRSIASHDAKTGKVLWENTTFNGDNCAQPIQISENELFYSKGYGRGSLLFSLSKDDKGQFTVEIAWKKSRVLKTKFTNPVIHKGLAYGISNGSALQCVDPKTGKMNWRHKGKFGHGQMLLVGDRLLIQTEWGKLILAEANPKEYKEIASFQALESRTWNVPVLVGSYLLVRNEKNAACYQLTLKKP